MFQLLIDFLISHVLLFEWVYLLTTDVLHSNIFYSLAIAIFIFIPIHYNILKKLLIAEVFSLLNWLEAHNGT